MSKMTDSELCALIDRLSKDAIGADDYYAQQRERAMEFYLGEAKGELSAPEVPGSSRVVSKDLMDTVEWAMPGIMEALTGADDIVSFKAKRRGDEKSAQDATKYANHIVYEENEGFTILHDAIKSCLITRMGVVKVSCDKTWEEREERYEGLSQDELAALEQDPDIEVVEQEQAGFALAPDSQPVPVFNAKAKTRQQVMKFCCDGVPPEEIRISKNCRQISDVGFIEHLVERTRSDLISDGWPRKEVDQIPTGSSHQYDGDELSRRDYDGSWDSNEPQGDRSQEVVCVSESYVKVDWNGDGVAEYRRVLKAGTYVHENEVTDDHPFALFTPILMPYKVIGLSFYDLVEDLMRIKTTLTRQVLDNVYLSNRPMRAVNESVVNLDDLLQPRPGGIVRVKNGTPPANAIQDMAVPFVASAGLEIINQVDQVRDKRTGVTEVNSALNADSLSKGSIGSEGVQEMMQAGAQRQRLIARVLAETGIKRMYTLILKNVSQYQDHAAEIEVNGQWLEIDPREWKNGFRLQVNVGVGTIEKRQEIQNLTLIGQMQERMLPLGLVKPENVYETGASMVRAMGYRDPERFFTAIGPNNPPPNQGPPPEVQLEQLKQQGAKELAQVKGQVDVHVAQMQQQAQAAQAQQETELEAQRNQVEMQNQMFLKRYEIDKDIELKLAIAQIDRDTQLQIAQINAQATAQREAAKPKDGAE